MSIQDRVLEVVREVLALRPENVDLDASIAETLAPNSLDQVRLYMTLEDEFDGTIPEEDLTNIRTLRDVVRYIEQRTEAAS